MHDIGRFSDEELVAELAKRHGMKIEALPSKYAGYADVCVVVAVDDGEAGEIILYTGKVFDDEAKAKEFARGFGGADVAVMRGRLVRYAGRLQLVADCPF